MAAGIATLRELDEQRLVERSQRLGDFLLERTQPLVEEFDSVREVRGLGLIWAGWNGAATYNDIRKQFPYLISGGIAGLALVVIGVGLMVIQSQRADRVQLEANLVELRAILERMTGGPAPNGAEPESTTLVVAGPNAYHRPSCKLVASRAPRTPSTTLILFGQ